MIISPGFSRSMFLIYDQKISLFLQGNNSHPVLDYSMEGVTQITPFIEIGWLADLWVNRDISYDINTAEMGVTALIADQLSVAVLKYTVSRKRPPREQYKPRLWNTRITPSFPSGHTSATAVFATILAERYPELTLPVTFYTLISAYSQVYVGNHYVSDVAGGVLLGIFIGKLILSAEMQTANSDKNKSMDISAPLNLTISIPLNSKP